MFLKTSSGNNLFLCPWGGSGDRGCQGKNYCQYLVTGQNKHIDSLVQRKWHISIRFLEMLVPFPMGCRDVLLGSSITLSECHITQFWSPDSLCRPLKWICQWDSTVTPISHTDLVGMQQFFRHGHPHPQHCSCRLLCKWIVTPRCPCECSCPNFKMS